MSIYPKDVEIEVLFITPENGGHKGPIFSGMRPLFHYDGTDWGGAIHFESDEQLPKGILVKLYFAFINPNHQLKRIYPGKEFELRDGKKVIARGQVLKLIDLENSAKYSSLK